MPPREKHLEIISQSTSEAQKRGADSAAQARVGGQIRGYNRDHALAEQVVEARAKVGRKDFLQHPIVTGLIFIGNAISESMRKKP